jgi:Tfp pilus assembly protein PilN
MRPVNLIPPDQRRGDSAPLRTGPLAYIVVGALALALLGVTLLVLASNEVAEKKGEVVTLRREDKAAQARAERLAPYSQFQALSQQRVETVASLANSRFDWPRVMRELALVLPGDVLLTNLTSGGGAGEGESEGEGLGGSQGPALELTGCTTGQDEVASFVNALKDIDGVTRVGLESSVIGEDAGGGGEGECPPAYVAEFQITAAFDAAPVPLAAEGEEVEVEPSEEPDGEEAEGEEG